MSRALRALDIRSCIRCFVCLGKPCGEAGRATAVHCGVCINNSRGCCCGCGNCLAKCCHCCMHVFGSFLRFALVVGFVLVSAFVIWANWAAISETAGGLYNVTSNATVEYYDKIQEDPNVQNFFNKTSGYYDTAKDQINQGIDKIGSNPDVERFRNRTAEVYDSAKNATADAFDSIKNGTAGVWETIKGWKIWGR